ncbi:MAG: AAA family ATPase [Salinicola sp.]|uniref:ATP-dependent nuclease n=1 Tax=Salinicola sp. TaxID=1978524 RepID=UPI001DE76DAF|nr:AAA family ATPase [Salinicola sp.]NRB55765.1 AAA family ATPase [Salinicola sp.]
MKLIEIRVRNFRSIEAEQHFSIPGRMTLVGPNNSGKTNLLRAIQVLFTGQANTYGYKRGNDLTFGVGKARTSITATFDGDPETEGEIYDSIDELHQLQGTARTSSQLNLTLYFTDANTPVYSFFPNVKRPKPSAQAAQYSRTHIALLNRLIDMFSLHYVPSAKSIDQIYFDLLTPFLRRKVSKVIEPHLSEINKSLDEAANALNNELKSAKLSEYEASFSLPGQSVEALVSGFDFMISDPQKTPIHEKGMGIQSTALLAAFRWITKQEKSEGRESLWLLEEPESYLHPDLAANCNYILDNLAKDSTVIKTTHSMAFVPQNPNHVSGTRLNSNNRTEIESYKTFSEAVSAIRGALGIKFGDFYNLAIFNVFVEGPTDREIFGWILDKLPEANYPFSSVRQSKFEDFGGVKHLSGFLRATYQFIQQEYACVTVFDGDEAGEQERRNLQAYFGRKSIPFDANRNFVSVRSRFAIEGLFPDDWIITIHKEHPSWFDSFSVDASGELEPFKVKDSNKSQVQAKLISLAEAEESLDWANRFINVFQMIDAALASLHTNLQKQ